MSVIKKYNDKDKSLVITINGDFNFDVHNAFRNSYRGLSLDDVNSISINMQNADYMDSSALGMLLLLDEQFPDTPINIINTPDYIKQVLAVANFETKFTIT